jgi:hypothetical protein
MAKHLLFLVHGMGVHRDAAWANGPITKLKELSSSYPFFTDRPLAELVEFKPIQYDHVLSSVLDRWEKLPVDVTAFATQAGLPHADALGWLQGISAEESDFFWTHAADVLIYRCFGLERTAIQAHVVAELSREIQKHKAADQEAPCSLLSHSLGTAVAHDCLQAMGTQTFTDHANALAPQHFRFNALITLANVSPILSQPYDSIVRPGPRGNPQSYCLEFLNARHEFDPFTLLTPFQPTGWGFAYASAKVRHVRQWNVHDLEHFLEHPAVHVPLFNALAGAQVISTQEKRRRIQAYEALDPLEGSLLEEPCKPLALQLREKLEEIRGLQDSFEEGATTVWEWVELGLRAQERLRELRSILDDLLRCIETNG